MKRLTHNLIQGSPEWLAFRARHFGASEAGAMLGLSPKTTRPELLRQKHLGLGKDFSQFVQEKVLDEGHRVEAQARPIVERVVLGGAELYPVTMSYGKLSASCDGLTIDDLIAFEHKHWNEPMAALMREGTVPPEHMPQCQQVLLVTGAERLLFVLSDGTQENMLWVWVMPDQAWFDRITRGWEQFAADLTTYVLPAAPPPAAVAKVVEALPIVFDMRVEGRIVSCNVEQYKPLALARIAEINTKLSTDQDFVDADADAKWCRESAKKLDLSIEQALGQMGDINAAIATVREIADAFNKKGLALEKLIASEKENRKNEIVAGGVKELCEHMAALATRVGLQMPAVPADFMGVVKGKRLIESIQAAVNGEVARVKIAASEIADRMQANKASLTANGSDWAFLFPDLAAVANKAPEDFANLLASRVTTHKEAEAARKAREDAEAARIAQEAAQRAIQVAQTTPPPAPVAATAPVAAPAPVAASPRPVVGGASSAGYSRPAAVSRGAPTMKLGEIGTRLEFTVTEALLDKLGFKATLDRGAKLYHEADFGAICEALIAHITKKAAADTAVPF